MQVVQDRYAPGVQECFRRFDEDNSGSLGSSELRGALKSLGLAVTSTQAAAPAGELAADLLQRQRERVRVFGAVAVERGRVPVGVWVSTMSGGRGAAG